MFQFKELIKAGKDSASLVEQNRASVNDVFSALNADLATETQGKVSIVRFIFRLNGITRELVDLAKLYKRSFEPAISIEQSLQKGTLDIKVKDNHEPVARWEQHPDGYPYTIDFLDERTDCWDQESLATTLGKIVSSGQFWLKVKELERKAQTATEDQNNNIPDEDVSQP
ncbi:hypothetical protein [Dickeya dadantii]|uniref:hypothetical protein n=1 Tax=Dickeya dadantii TaxID=204038 RepID=UPI001CC645CB|nr:hypothetical protein [Dickeya dadantii]UAY97546.1 hypothetical protein KTF62_06620 [Dickeya dadantii]